MYIITLPQGVDSMNLTREGNSFVGSAQAGNESIPFNSQCIIEPPSMSMGPMQNAVVNNDGTVTMSEPGNPSVQAPSGVATGMANTNEDPTMGKSDKTDSKSS